MKDGYQASTKKNELKVKKASNVLDKRQSKTPRAGTGAAGDSADDREDMSSPVESNIPVRSYIQLSVL
jgi:hypothetical protein